MSLRDDISQNVSHAIQGVMEFKSYGDTTQDKMESYYRNRHNWIQIATDNIIKAFLEDLPPAVDIPTKYELHPSKGLHVQINDSEERNDMMLEYLSEYSTDNGRNEYRWELVQKINGMYDLPTFDKSATIKRIGD